MRAKRISVLATGAAAVLALGGCSSTSAPTSAGSASIIGGDYSSTTALLSALSAAGIPCFVFGMPVGCVGWPLGCAHLRGRTPRAIRPISRSYRSPT